MLCRVASTSHQFLFILSATARAGGRPEVDEAPRNAGQRRHHPTAPEAPGRPFPCEDDCTGGRHRRLELAKGSDLRDHYCRPGAARGCRCAANRTTAGTAEWLGQHPEVEFVSRDRCGLYAQGAREGAPQARQVADRFHLLQNLRETIETQLSRTDRSTGRALLPESNDEDVARINLVREVDATRQSIDT